MGPNVFQFAIELRRIYNIYLLIAVRQRHMANPLRIQERFRSTQTFRSILDMWVVCGDFDRAQL